MSLTTWPTLADVLTSGYNVREPGLKTWLSCNTVAAYPTLAAGTDYLGINFTATTGWSVNSGTPVSTFANGIWNIVMDATYEGYTKSVTIGRTIKIRARVTSGTFRIATDTNVVYITSSAWNTYTLIATTAIFAMYSNVGSTIVDIEWIYVGTGEYAANALIDNSGNGLHGAAYGITPGTGKSGNGIIFDGVNDYILIGLIAATYPVLYISAWIKLSSATSFCLFDPRNDAGVGGTPVMTDEVKFYVDGSTSLARVPYDGLWHHVIVPLSAIVVSKAWFGRTYAGASYLSGTVDELRFYSVLDSYRMATLYAEPTTYEALPEYPLADGHTVTRQSGVIRTEMDSGPPKVRTRFTARCKYPVYQYYMSRAQKQILDQFYDGLGGSLPFDFTDPDTGEVWSATFLGEPTYQVDGLGYRVNIPLEVLP